MFLLDGVYSVSDLEQLEKDDELTLKFEATPARKKPEPRAETRVRLMGCTLSPERTCREFVSALRGRCLTGGVTVKTVVSDSRTALRVRAPTP